MWLGVKREDLVKADRRRPIPTIPTRGRWCRVESDFSTGTAHEPMATSANPSTLAQQARRSYAERLLEGVPTLVQAVEQGPRV
jgi:hypothetical protein